VERDALTDRAEGEAGSLTPALGRTVAATAHPFPYDPRSTILEYDLLNAKEVLDHYVDRLLSRKPSPIRCRTLLEAFSPDGRPFRRDAPDRDDRIRDLVFLLTSTPEYQVN
jgi:hypothetical protein